jgi:hypothetical protein
MKLLFNFKGPLLKPKPKNPLLLFFEFFNIHFNNLTRHSIINMALKWHRKNMSNKITVFIKFLVCLIITTPCASCYHLVLDEKEGHLI